MTRRAAGWVAAVALLWVFGGVVGAATGLVLAAWHLSSGPDPVSVLVAAVAVLACVPVAWVLGNADRLGSVTPDLVLDNPWPGVLATAGVTLLVVGTVLDDRRPEEQP